jgi:hypothetical protein
MREPLSMVSTMDLVKPFHFSQYILKTPKFLAIVISYYRNLSI